MHPYVHYNVVYSTIAKIFKQPKCPSIDEWIKQLWYIYTMEYYLPVKNQKILSFVIARWTWKKLCYLKQASQKKISTIWFHSHVESNEQTKLTSKIESDSETESRLTALGVEGQNA